MWRKSYALWRMDGSGQDPGEVKGMIATLTQVCQSKFQVLFCQKVLEYWSSLQRKREIQLQVLLQYESNNLFWLKRQGNAACHHKQSAKRKEVCEGKEGEESPDCTYTLNLEKRIYMEINMNVNGKHDWRIAP